MPAELPLRPDAPASGADSSATPDDACGVIQTEHMLDLVRLFADFDAARSTMPTSPASVSVTMYARSGALGSRHPRKSR